ncbi:MAG: helix-turn-helix domain-containing protein [Candidatus Obscuribacterales bacterium]|nr:helix-turn-helix domain-containing protein [Candidatus Obscuribacterales bacterium]
MCINRIRKKIEGLSETPLIATVHGVGYKFVPPGKANP